MTENEILRRTSRSFYLTIRLLPRAVRSDVSLGYLLARATDTLADASSAPEQERLALLRSLRGGLDAGEWPAAEPAAWARLQRDPAEQRLIEELPRLWRAMASRSPAARQRLADVMAHVLDGQIFDLERFGEGAPPLTAGELDRYTYLVAGSVGEFWTDLCEAALPGWTSSPLPWMREHGRKFGQGLQLVNILRDRQMDRALGRAYLPEDEAAASMADARERLALGAAYCAALRPGRLRYAVLLPVLLGMRTLALVERHPPGLLTPAKVSRREARAWLLRAAPAWWSVAAVPRLVAAASK